MSTQEHLHPTPWRDSRAEGSDSSGSGKVASWNEVIPHDRKRSRGDFVPAASICIADTDFLRSQLLSSALRRLDGFDVSVVNSREEILDTFRLHPPDVAIVSLNILEDGQHAEHGSQDEMYLLRKLRSFATGVRIILVAHDPEPFQIVLAFQAGIRGILCPRNVSFKLLRKCISRVMQGQFWISTEQLNHIMKALENGPVQRPAAPALSITANLTRRETQVMDLAAKGLSNRSISERLLISEHTVKKYLISIFAKAGVRNRVELALCVTGARPVLRHEERVAARAHGPAPGSRQVLSLLDARRGKHTSRTAS